MSDITYICNSVTSGGTDVGCGVFLLSTAQEVLEAVLDDFARVSSLNDCRSHLSFF